MEVTVSIPDRFIPPLEPGADVSRQVLEAYAIEMYRQTEMSLGAVAELLDLSIDETNAFFKKHGVPSNYDLEDVERDRQTIEKLFGKK